MGKFDLYNDEDITLRHKPLNLRRLVELCRARWGIEADPSLWCLRLMIPGGKDDRLPRGLVHVSSENQGDGYHCLHLNEGEYINREPMKLHKLRSMLLGDRSWTRPLFIVIKGEVYEEYELELHTTGGPGGLQEARFVIRG